MTTPPADPGLFTTWALLQQAYGLLYKRLDQRLAKLGSSQAQAAVLVVLKSVDAPLPLSRLARLLVQEAQSVTSLVDRLEAQNLVRRVPSRQDRRVIYVELTEAGEERFAVLGPAIAEALEEVLGVCNARELQTLSKLLRRLRDRGVEALNLKPSIFAEVERDGIFAPHDAESSVPSTAS